MHKIQCMYSTSPIKLQSMSNVMFHTFMQPVY